MTDPSPVQILSVEDEPGIQLIAKTELKATGEFAVALCSSGREAVSELRGRHPYLLPEMFSDPIYSEAKLGGLLSH